MIKNISLPSLSQLPRGSEVPAQYATTPESRAEPFATNAASSMTAAAGPQAALAAPQGSDPSAIMEAAAVLYDANRYSIDEYNALCALMQHPDTQKVARVLLLSMNRHELPLELREELLRALAHICRHPQAKQELIDCVVFGDVTAACFRDITRLALTDLSDYGLKVLICDKLSVTTQVETRREIIVEEMAGLACRRTTYEALRSLYLADDSKQVPDELRVFLAQSLQLASRRVPAITQWFVTRAREQHWPLQPCGLLGDYLRAQFDVDDIFAPVIDALIHHPDAMTDAMRTQCCRDLRQAANHLPVRVEMANYLMQGEWTDAKMDVALHIMSSDPTPRTWPKNAADFFAALFAAEDFRERSLALLPMSEIETMRSVAQYNHVSLIATIGANSHGDKHWELWAADAGLSTAAAQQLPAAYEVSPFDCSLCCESKAAHERAVWVSCKSAQPPAMCLSCAISTVLQSDNPKLRNKCPDGCGAPLAIQDMVAWRLPAARIQSVARHNVFNSLAQIPFWRHCDKADCWVGGNVVPPDAGKGVPCLCCKQTMRVRMDGGVLRRLLHGFLNQLTPGTSTKTYSCDACGALTEKSQGCDHMTCPCGNEWWFSTPRLPHRGMLFDADFFAGVTREGEIRGNDKAMLLARARDWLRHPPAHLLLTGEDS